VFAAPPEPGEDTLPAIHTLLRAGDGDAVASGKLVSLQEALYMIGAVDEATAKAKVHKPRRPQPPRRAARQGESACISMMLKVLLPFEVFAQGQGVTRIVFETPPGSSCVCWVY